jgi:Flp pilus assembly protein TadD
VSAEELRHPLSRKGAKMLRKAQEMGQAGDHSKAIEELRRALKERSAIPYAHSLLGVEYLKTRQVPAAVQELRESVKLLPHSSGNHSNLGYALYLSGQKEEGELEVHQALLLDKNNRQAQYLLGVMEPQASH